MISFPHRLPSAFLLLFAAWPTQAQSPVEADHARRMQAGLELFKSDIRPLLERHCLDCHGGKATKGDVDLGTREALLKSEMLGKDSASSTLFKVVAHIEDPHMPHKAAKLPDADIAKLAKWIDLGSPYDKPLIEAKKGPKKEMVVTDADRDYWAFRQVKAPGVPVVADKVWNDNPIDSFIRHSQEKAGLKPVAEIDRRGLIRRVYFDLIGLPPEPKVVEEFVQAADFETAYAKIVDGLLASPHHGERWARHWLDVARYGESHGFEHDYDRHNAYHYRDFVIKAFNANMPFDRFLRWQLAGDELAPNDPLALSATGFLAAGVYPTQITNREAERVRYDAMDDMLATTGSAMLGLTIGCARCHDHKYDPIPTRDYYSLLSAFTTTVRAEIDWDFGTEAEKQAMRDYEAKLKPFMEARTKFEGEQLAQRLQAWVELRKQAKGEMPSIGDPKTAASLKRVWDAPSSLAKLEKPRQTALLNWFKPQDEVWRKLDEPIIVLEKQKPKDTKRKIQVCTEGVKPMRHHTATGDIPDFYPTTYFLKRGDVDQKEGEIATNVLHVLSRTKEPLVIAKPHDAKTSGRRSSVAFWISDTETGAGSLAARVIVNRVWHHHFGRGIVSTINDFGIQGEKPSHPELLEWLADDFVDHDWDLKRLHKLIVESRVYRLGNANEAANAKIDPDNKLLWHRTPRRLEAEIIRDNLLSVSGQLDATMYGEGTLNEAMKRRSIYFQIKRSQLIPFMQVFDWPDTLTSGGVRSNTVIAPQALVFLNNSQVRSYAAAFGRKLKAAAQEAPEKAVDLAYRLAFARPATKAELAEGTKYLESEQGDGSKLDKALTDYALILMSLNEFIFVK